MKLRKERDFHRMHHKRIVQEKNKLITDIKRLKNHYASYEPTLRQLKQKYETAMKEKMLTKLERDRAVGQVQGLKSTLKNMEQYRSGSATTTQMALGHFIYHCYYTMYVIKAVHCTCKMRTSQLPMDHNVQIIM